jgi:hypothetical protein
LNIKYVDAVSQFCPSAAEGKGREIGEGRGVTWISFGSVTVFWRPWAPNAPRATEMKPFSLVIGRGSREEKKEKKKESD